ncbi:unnamed protein product [Rotaria socialis]|nr:unnamed protein product [Rotaria socialis]
MMNKVTPQSGTVLMAFAVFFAVVFGIWAPATNKSGIDDRSLSLENSFIPSNNYQSAFATQKSLFEQQESTPSNYVSDKFKSRVLLSIDETDNHHYGPYLPSKNEYQSSFRRESAAPGYTYSHTVEKYMNKKLNSEKSIEEAHDNNFKQTLADESSSLDYIQEPAHKKRKANYHMSENFIVVEETNEEMDAVLNESKQVKIIRVERTIPAFGNDSLKLAHQTIDK